MIRTSRKQAVLLGALSAGAIGLSFLYQWYIFTRLGPGAKTDALFAGMTIPQIVLMVISGSLMNVLVPLLTGESEASRHHDTWAILTVVAGLFGVIAFILFILAPWWVPLSVPGFDLEGKRLTIELTQIQLVGMVFAAINGVQWAAYHSRQRFLWAESTPILAGLASLLILIWALPRFGVVAAAWISTLRLALQTVLLAPGMGRPIRPDFRSPAIGQSWERMKPLLLGAAYYKTDPLVDRFLLSSAGTGSLSLYYFAQQLYNAVIFVLSRAISAPMVPRLSRLHKADLKAEFGQVYRRELLVVGGVGVAGFLVFALLGKGCLSLLVGHGSVTAGNVVELYWIMLWLAGLLIGGAAGQVCASSFYACGDTVTPTRMSMWTYTVYIPGKLLAFYVFGIMGLAVSTSVYYFVNLALQIMLLEKKLST